MKLPNTDFSTFEDFALVAGERKLYVLQSDLCWNVGKKDSGYLLELPLGTTFDISIPRLFEWLLNPHDRRVLLAAALHDELLRRGFDIGFASAEFRRAAIARHYPGWKAWGLFGATLIWTAASRKKALPNH